MASEKRLIAADVLYDKLIYDTTKTEIGGGEYISTWRISDAIEEAPTVDAVEVVNGHWISKGYRIECSVCEHGVFLGTHDPVIHAEEKNIRKYCHNCGAKMDGGNDV